ncbi:MAG: hypothetical protein H6832_17520 [Planctomycetes bacterium]|nr:hypothetical protein [Planctomycetota bacterium]
MHSFPRRILTLCLTLVALAGAGSAQGGEARVTPQLVSSLAQISVQSGGEQRLWLDAGAKGAGMPFVILGSASGTMPGLLVGGARVPLNVDAYFWLSLGAQNPLLLGGQGRLDAQGSATSLVRVPAAVAQLLRLHTLQHAAVVFTTEQGTPSNAVPLRFGRDQPRPSCGGVTFSITGPMQHAAGTNTCGWFDREASAVCRDTRATLGWLTNHFGGLCFVDPNVVYESAFAIHKGNRKDPPFFAQFFPAAQDKDGNTIKYRLRILGDIVQGTWPTPVGQTTVLEFPSYYLAKDTGKGKAPCLQTTEVAFPNGGKVVVTLSR